ncbi:M23 family metallopeptidase [Planosporangium thailandense]|uniref:M23 family metallopeptidase n=2 Tax=Planosporangium thailandense TaxID=765197 RepID=A0ABX0XQK1_9ACTN|nr:M23 family metallopeptidase [Planosporangium thailandense]
MVGGPGAPGGARPVAAAPARPAAPISPGAAMPPALPRSSASSRSPSSPGTPGSPVGARFRWPLDGRPSVVRRFAPPPQPWLPGHRGVDLSAEAGAPVYAAGPGVVRFAGMLAGRGVVSVDHPNGLRTTYEPVTPVVVAGQQVRAGDVIGKLDGDHPGCPAVYCLHWGLRLGATYLDPLALVGVARVRLLPLATNTP